MLDFKDLKDFYNLPSEFNSVGLAEIKSALQEFQDYKKYIVDSLEHVGGDYGFKNPDVYDDVESEIKWCKFPPQPEKKFLAVLEHMRKTYCLD